MFCLGSPGPWTTNHDYLQGNRSRSRPEYVHVMYQTTSLDCFVVVLTVYPNRSVTNKQKRLWSGIDLI